MSAIDVVRLWHIPLRYFTVLSLVLVLTSPYSIQFFNLYYLTLIVCVIGSYLVWISPRKITVSLPTSTFVLQGNILKAADFAFHVLPFIYVAACYGKYYATHKYDVTLVTSIAIITLYIVIWVNPEALYELSYERFIYLFSLANGLYFIFL